MNPEHSPTTSTEWYHADSFDKDPVSCILCGESQRDYLFPIGGALVSRCRCCGLAAIDPAGDALRRETFERRTLNSDGSNETDPVTEADAARRYLDALAELKPRKGKLLIVAPSGHPVAPMAKDAGWEIGTHIGIGDIGKVGLGEGEFAAAILVYQLEQTAFPMSALTVIRDALAPEGKLLLTIRSTDSWPARWLRARWPEWRRENNFYFGNSTIQSLLMKSGFAGIRISPDRRFYTLRHIFSRAAGAPRTILTRSIALFGRVMPNSLHDARLRFSTSGIVISASKGTLREKPLLSIILPAYNECRSFEILMDALLEKEVRGMDKEVIVVESNSTDGTRESVLKYESNPQVRICLQPKAKGKGFAVREGLRKATGDIVMIQDADLEYDLNDYDSLLAPILKYQTHFVLGARHGGSWKMREFAGEKSISTMLNLGHVFFTTLINGLYGQRMKDPFTMFKVFRRECIHRLHFECNRFDFDHELVIKLVCKGYTPLEIPVNYRSRSFKEGKKVRYRDAFAWIWYDFKFRFASIYEKPGEMSDSRGEAGRK